MPGSREQTPRGSHSIGFSFQQPLANGNAAITDVSRTNQWGGDTPGRYEWVVSQRESNSYPANAVIPPPCLPICPTDSLHPLEMVVVGAPKVIFIPGNQCEQADALGSLMLPVSSPGSPESASNEQPPRKRQRLTHLTPEEKALRRKLKNRVAAQTARDRKKAKMGELEQQVIDLEIENEKLLLENQILRDKSHGLLAENQELRQRLGLSTLELKKEESSSSSQGVRSTQTTCPSAAGAGPDVSEPDSVYMDPDSPDTSDSESDLLLGLLESLDSDLLLAYEGALAGSPDEEIKGDESDSISSSPSSPVGTPSAKLEAINELIRFDHVYTKPLSTEEDSAQSVETSIVVKMEEASFSPTCDDGLTCVKQEPQEDGLVPILGMQSFLPCSENNLEKSNILDTGSDSGYEGSSSPFSDLSSPLNSDRVWEDSFSTELFPQLLLSAHMDQSICPSSPVDAVSFWSHSSDFDDVHF
ncbi:transcriptional activator hacA-like isoform X3 [Xenopus laevis]|uniref:X-box-binding protein 1 n=1 Tax=Xenopus laevis TaxID=8355 RepID=A0A8J1M3R7_XENLA|nr:transcriptional activator hacA-like isoform X3 [Xenopus laevis]